MDKQQQIDQQRYLDTLKKARKQIHSLSRQVNQPIAVVGQACRLPGADSPEALWQLICDAKEALSEVEPSRWDLNSHYSAVPGTPYKTYVRQAGYLEKVDNFDAEFFGISPREARQMDPQQRLLMEVSYRAFEDADIPVTRLKSQSVGVYIGISSSEYAVLTFRPDRKDSQDAFSITGTSTNSAAGRLSFHYGFNGPSMAIDTACSSSLVAIYQATRSLVNNECHTAVAGGVNCLLMPQTTIALSQNKVLSQSGHCSPFSASADGIVRAEGCALFILRRLSDAINDGNQILAVIRSGHVNQDGASSGLTVPNGKSQQQLIAKAVEKARIEPNAVSYIEAHGTGTELGDPIELKALDSSLCRGRSPEHKLKVGSVKANLGHLEAASGAAGLLKLLLMMRHKMLPGQINVETLSPHIHWDRIAIDIPQQPQSLTFDAEHPLYCGVSSFGFSGTNAHLVVQDPVSAVAEYAKAEGQSLQVQASDEPMPTTLLALSAKSAKALSRRIADYQAFLSEREDWQAACDSHNHTRAHYNVRAAFVAKDREGLVQQLSEAQSQAFEPLDVVGAKAWLFTGQGSQYRQMGEVLYHCDGLFRSLMDNCDEAIKAHLGQSILPVMWGQAEDINDTRFTQPGIFCLQYALSHYLKAKGVMPEFVLGHSIGEYAAAVLAGVFSLEDAARMIVYRGRLMHSRCQPGKMAVLFCDRQTAQTLLAPHSSQASLAVVNGPNNHVLSGTVEAVEQIVAAAQARSIRAVMLNVSHAFHSLTMEPMLAEFKSVVAQTRFSFPKLSFVSTALGRPAEQELMSPEYWVNHVRGTVEYQQAIEQLFGEGSEVDLCIEIGPHDQLLKMAKPMINRSGIAFHSLLAPKTDLTTFNDTFKTLYLRGDYDFSQGPRGHAAHLSLPGYPLEPKRFWLADHQIQQLPQSFYQVDAVDIGSFNESAEGALCDDALLLLTGREDTALESALGNNRQKVVTVRLDQDSVVESIAKALSVVEGEDFGAIVYLPMAVEDEDCQLPALQLTQALNHIHSLPEFANSTIYCLAPMVQGEFDLVGATLAGACRSLSQEGLTLSLRLLGIEQGVACAALKHCAESVPSETYFAEYKYFCGRVTRPQVVATELSQLTQDAKPLDPQGTYLVTGGSGAVGKVLLRTLLHRGARHLLVLSRNAQSEQTLKQLIEDEQLNHPVQLQVLPIDITDGISLKPVFEILKHSPQPLKGIVHAAGVLADGSWQTLDEQAFAATFDAKVKGAVLLDRLSEGLALDCFVVIGSIAGVLGSAGQLNYAAANAALNALMAARIARGEPALSLCLGPLAGGGMAQSEAAMARLKRAGIVPMGEQRLFRLLGETIECRHKGLLLCDLDLPQVAKRAAQLPIPILDSLLAGQRELGQSEIQTPVAAPSNATVTAAKTTINDVPATVKHCIAEVLGIDEPESIGDRQTLSELGMDSITLVELRDALNRRFSLSLNANVMYDYPQVDKLTGHIGEHLSESEQPLAAASATGKTVHDEPIAIIGMGCRLPGGVDDVEQFWQALSQGRDLIGEIDDQRWRFDRYREGRDIITRKAGVIDDIAGFDCDLFGISPREAQAMDPQQRILLEVAWQALQHAGFDFNQSDVNGGVFVGPGPNDYAKRFDQSAEAIDHHLGTGNAPSVLAGRLAYQFDWHGPTLVVDTACSSSLVAVHLACRALAGGECDIALAGGVNLLLAPETSVMLSKGGMLSPVGQCKAFDASADGYVRSEGCALVVLKRLSDAEQQGDRIVALIKGSASNQDGHSQGLTAPNGVAQKRVITAALQQAGVSPAEVGMIEAHGTGTPLGDPIEMNALGSVYGQAEGRTAALSVGSVKSNAGHLEAAAGVAGLVKAALCLKHRTKVPHLHFSRLNPEIDIDAKSVCVQTQVEPWHSESPRYAGVSSFGFSGTNVHLLLSDYTESEAPSNEQRIAIGSMATLQVSAVNKDSLKQYLARYRDALKSLKPGQFEALCSLSLRNAILSCSVWLQAFDGNEMVAAIERLLGSNEALEQAMSQPRPTLEAQDKPLACDIRAPLYPFNHQRFWLAPKDERKADTRKRFVGSRLTSRAAANVTYAVDYRNDPPFDPQEHIVHGKPVIPAAAHLSLLVNMAQELYGEGVYRLANVTCVEALVLDDDSAAVMYSFESRSGGYDIKVYSELERGTSVHLRAELTLSSAAALKQCFDSGRAGELNNRLGEIDGSRFYDDLLSEDIELGSSFRRVRRIEQAKGLCRAQIQSVGGGFICAPGELDAYLQTIALSSDVEELGTGNMSGAVIPLAVDELLVDGRTASVAETMANCDTLVRQENTEARVYSHDIAVASNAQPFLTIKGLTTKGVDEAHLSAGISTLSRYLTECWQPLELHLEAEKGQTARLIHADDATAVAFASCFELSEQDSADHWIYCIDAHEADLPQTEQHCQALLALFKRLAAMDKAPALTILSRQGVAVSVDEIGLPLLGWVSGLIKSLQLELPSLPCRLIDTDIDGLALAARAVATGGEPFIACRGEQGFGLRVLEQPWAQLRSTQLHQIDAEGYYVLTGGSGDLALAIAQGLIDLGATRLALLGRRAQDESIALRIAGLELPAGGDVTIEYYQADVADYDALAEQFDRLAAKAPINGIIHTAGVLKDGLFNNLDQADFARVMAAKVNGSWHLHQLSLTHRPSLFVLFSSLASLLGALGQSNYAAANGFMDSLCHYRSAQGMPALSINWGGWEAIGMAQRTAGQGGNELGLGMLSPAQGVAEFLKLTSAKAPQLGVVPLDKVRFNRYWQSQASVPTLIAALVDSPDDLPVYSPDDLHAVASQGFLVELEGLAPAAFEAKISEQVAFEVRRIAALGEQTFIDPDKPFQEAGFDSVMSLELKAALEKGFELSLPSTLVFDFPTVTALSRLIGEKLTPEPAIEPVQTPAEDAAVPGDDDAQSNPSLDQMSEDELANLLGSLI